MSKVTLVPVHPGEILREEYLVPLKMSAGGLAKQLGVPRTRIERIVGEQTSVSPDTAVRLARFFTTTPAFWMNLQTSYDLSMVKNRIDVSKIDPLRAVTA